MAAVLLAGGGPAVVAAASRVALRDTSPFIILGLPRSRTYWLSQFLSYGGWHCGHEESIKMRGLDDLRSYLAQKFSGSAETAAAPYWRLLRRLSPNLKIVVVRRPVDEVVASLVRTGIVSDRTVVEAEMRKVDAKLDQIEKRAPGVLSIKFSDLNKERVCKQVFEFCLPFSHDRAWWLRLAQHNLQTNLPAMKRYMISNWPQICKFAAACAQEERRALWNKRAPFDQDGMTFQEESFRDFFDGAQQLFKEHAAAIGEPEDEIFHMNLGLMDDLYNRGAMQIVTARSNGRMFGYLMTVLGPGLEKPNLMVAVQTLFYGSPDARGVGTGLQKASVTALEARGGEWSVIQKAGHRGSGPRLGAMFKRMGSEDLGTLHRFSVGGG